MRNRPWNYSPAVVAARDGSKAIELLKYEGKEGISNRDAVGFYFTIKLAPGKEDSVKPRSAALAGR